MHTTATFDLVPRSLDDQQQWIADRSGAFAAVAAVDGDVVVGFGSLSPYKERAAYRTSVEDSVYVATDHQGRGIGKLILGELVAVARLSGFHSVFARIDRVQRGQPGLARFAAGSTWSASSERSGASSTAGSTSRSMQLLLPS